MVTSVLPMMMMMTLSLVEFVQPQTWCHADEGYCPGSDGCYFTKDGDGHCCPSGDVTYGTAGCCTAGNVPYAFGTCCRDNEQVYGKIDGNLDCCGAGHQRYGVSDCCPTESVPYAVGGCCPKGYKAYVKEDDTVGCCEAGTKPWQMDDGKYMCCPNAKNCPRTGNPIEPVLRVDHDEE